MFRWLAVIVVLSAIGMSAFHRRRARRAGDVIARRRESGLLIAGRILIGLPLFLSVLTYIVNPDWMAWAAFGAPVRLRQAGVVLGIATLPMLWWVFASIGRNISETVLTKRDHALVTSGPYRRVRHPLYAIALLMFISVGLMAANLFILGMAGVALLAIIGLVIPREEAALIEKFGDDYRAYRRRTGGLVPRLDRKPPAGGP